MPSLGTVINFIFPFLGSSESEKEEAASATEDVSATPSDDVFTRSVDNIRRIANGILVTFGAIAGILIAGTQLSSIGQFEWSDTRLYFAIFAFTIALLGVGLCLRFVISVEAAGETTLSDLAEKEATSLKKDGSIKATSTKDPDIRFVHSNPEMLLGYKSITALQKDYRDAIEQQHIAFLAENKKAEQAANDIAYQLNAHTIQPLLSAVRYHRVKRTFDKGKDRILIVAPMIAVAIAVFVWAANPEDPPSSPDPFQLPVEAVVFQTDTDELERINTILGSDCPDLTTKVGVNVILLSSLEGKGRVVTVPPDDAEGCQPKTFTVNMDTVQPAVTQTP
jgi:hypothetical protein